MIGGRSGLCNTAKITKFLDYFGFKVCPLIGVYPFRKPNMYNKITEKYLSSSFCCLVRSWHSNIIANEVVGNDQNIWHHPFDVSKERLSKQTSSNASEVSILIKGVLMLVGDFLNIQFLQPLIHSTASRNIPGQKNVL